MAKDIFDRNYFSPVKEKEIGNVDDMDNKKKDDGDFILNDFVEENDSKESKMNKKRIKSDFKLKKEQKPNKINIFEILKNSKLIFTILIILLAIFNSLMLFNEYSKEAKMIANQINLSTDGKYFFSMFEVKNESIDTKVTSLEFVRFYFIQKPIAIVQYGDYNTLETFLEKYLMINYLGFLLLNVIIYVIGFKLLEYFLTGLFLLYSIIATKNTFKNIRVVNVVIKRSIFMMFITLFPLILLPQSLYGYLFYTLIVIIHVLIVLERKVLK
ncbi:MAG: hypothetical protein PHT94_02020 [Candidatus Nanoarchaeia archaeon]|nr:hypothetical protein [Candidatus Nanoarchaeia archaeon]